VSETLPTDQSTGAASSNESASEGARYRRDRSLSGSEPGEEPIREFASAAAGRAYIRKRWNLTSDVPHAAIRSTGKPGTAKTDRLSLRSPSSFTSRLRAVGHVVFVTLDNCGTIHWPLRPRHGDPEKTIGLVLFRQSYICHLPTTSLTMGKRTIDILLTVRDRTTAKIWGDPRRLCDRITNSFPAITGFRSRSGASYRFPGYSATNCWRSPKIMLPT